MCKPSQFINDVCSECHPRSYVLTLAEFAEEENIVELSGNADESYVEYLYQCCKCGSKVWVEDQWVKRNSVDVENN